MLNFTFIAVELGTEQRGFYVLKIYKLPCTNLD